MNYKQAQYLLDTDNYLEVPPGTHAITRPLQLGHLTGKIEIRGKGGSLQYNGPNGRGLFEFNKTGSHKSPHILFTNFIGNVANGMKECYLFKIISPNTAPRSLVFNNCMFGSRSAYAIDLKNGSNETEYIKIINCRPNCRGGTLRWRMPEPNATSQLYIINTRHQQSDIVGPAWDFKNVSNMICEVNTNEQAGNTVHELQRASSSIGPVVFRAINPRGYNLFHTWWMELNDGTGVRPNSWLAEVRVENDAPIGQYYIDCYDSTWHQSSPFNWRTTVVGGEGQNAPSIVRINNNNFALDAEYDKVGGKAWTKANRAFYWSSDTDRVESTGFLLPQDPSGWQRVSRYNEGNPAAHVPGETARAYNKETIDDASLWNNYERTGWIVERDYEDILWELEQKAFGGFMSESSGDIIHQFVENGIFIAHEDIEIEYLLVGGGGGGGGQSGSPYYGGGGGGGGVITNFEGTKIVLPSGTYQISIGYGGSGSDTAAGGNGGNTSFYNLIAYGGGGGGGGGFQAGSGGCGGGAGSFVGALSGVAVSGQGYDGGGHDEANGAGAAGGGGAGAPGFSNDLTALSSDGGDGFRSLIDGSEQYYGGGGPGGASNTAVGGLGNDINTNSPSSNQGFGTYGYGGGGMGRKTSSRVARGGGSGRVIIRYNATGVI